MKPQSSALSVIADPHLKADPWGWAKTSSVRPIDLVHLTRQTFGDKRLETELLRLFTRQSHQIDKSLDSVGDEDSQVSCIELLHMLSGSARAIGATEVAAMAGGFEARMRQGNETDLDRADRGRLSELIARTNHYIAELLDQG